MAKRTSGTSQVSIDKNPGNGEGKTKKWKGEQETRQEEQDKKMKEDKETRGEEKEKKRTDKMKQKTREEDKDNKRTKKRREIRGHHGRTFPRATRTRT